MPAGVAPAGSKVGELGSSVRVPPLTANTATAPALLSSTNRVPPSGLRRASTAPTPPAGPAGVLPRRVSAPPGGVGERGDVPGSGVPGDRNWAALGVFPPHGGGWGGWD